MRFRRLIFHTSRLSLSADPKVSEVSTKMLKNINSISDITHHVREMERAKSRPIKLVQVGIQDCLDEIKELFIERFNKKNIRLHLTNKAPLDVYIKVEKVIFIHSVLSNIISNALKFSHPGSEVILNVYESNGMVSFDTLDYGTGMNDKMLKILFEHEVATLFQAHQGKKAQGLECLL